MEEGIAIYALRPRKNEMDCRRGGEEKKREGKEVPYWHERMNERGKKTLCVTEVTSCKNRQQ